MGFVSAPQKNFGRHSYRLQDKSQPAKPRRPDVAFIVETYAEMIVSSTTQHDGDLAMKFDEFSPLYKVVKDK